MYESAEDTAVLCPRQRALLAAALVLCSGALIVSTTRPPSAARLQPVYDYQIDPNTAPLAVLVTLPGIGASRARAIITEREKCPFASLQDLEHRVAGIGPVTASGFKPYVAITPSSQDPPAPELANILNKSTIALGP